MANLDQVEQFNKGTIFPENYDETYLATKHIASQAIEIPEKILELLKKKIKEKGLYFGNDEVLREIITGLVKGNIILQGPPGTGKTTLAKLICEVFNVEYDEATAIADWTTYDTIGGLQPDFDGKNEILTGKNGCIVESIVHCCNAVVQNAHYGAAKQASWLILDELNRCEIDKVFGELFTVFGSDSLTNLKSIRLWYEKDENKKRIYIPNRYRIIGAMNNIDKNFVYDISQGLSRRFTFIEILPPEEEYFEEEIVNAKKQAQRRVTEKISSYGSIKVDNDLFDSIDNNSMFIAAEKDMKDFFKHIRYTRENDNSYLGLSVGTAQIIDVFETSYITIVMSDGSLSEMRKDDYTSIFDAVLASRVVPQLDGFDFRRLDAFFAEMSTKNEFAGFQKTRRAISKLIR